jgi:hypothetical protein
VQAAESENAPWDQRERFLGMTFSYQAEELPREHKKISELDCLHQTTERRSARAKPLRTEFGKGIAKNVFLLEQESSNGDQTKSESKAVSQVAHGGIDPGAQR